MNSSPVWLSLLAFIVPTHVWAWGTEGHVVTARIAEAHLSDRAKAGIKELIGERSISDKDVCTWADAIRNSAMYKTKYPDNQTWHYINLDVTEVNPDPNAKQFGDRNVLAAIERFRKVLKDPKIEANERKEALFFLVHFIGDMHQPLHCGSRGDDKGGNRVMVSLPKNLKSLRLHGIWDTDLVRQAMNELTADDYASRLDNRLNDEERSKVIDGEVKDWVLESQKQSKEFAYAGIPGDWPLDGKAFEITEEYVKNALPVIEKQLQRGGLRLAKVLNEVFAE
jgi:hypothetical protein